MPAPREKVFIAVEIDPALKEGLDQIKEREGIPIAESAARKEGDSLYVIDPDGVEIEVIAYRTDYRYR